VAKQAAKKKSASKKPSKPAPKAASKSSPKRPAPAIKAKPAARANPVLARPILSGKPASTAPADQAAKMAIAVPTDGKPRKNMAGLNAKDLEHFRDALLGKRRELLGDVRSMESEALRSSGGSNLSSLPIHMADMGTDNYEQEFTLGLVEKDRLLLREINQALAKIQNGTYGLCEGTGKPISKARLEAQPWARFSIENARAMEKRIGR
jgi:RNA polymerase-binding protein DksA